MRKPVQHLHPVVLLRPLNPLPLSTLHRTSQYRTSMDGKGVGLRLSAFVLYSPFFCVHVTLFVPPVNIFNLSFQSKLHSTSHTVLLEFR